MFYEVVRTNRKFTKDLFYSHIDWSDFASVVRAFQDRIQKWFLNPAHLMQNPSLPGNVVGHLGFPTMVLNCLLIDSLSQYHVGAAKAKPKHFIGFVDENLPELSADLPEKIELPDGHPFAPELSTVAQVLYQARCSLVHEASLPLYVGVTSLPTPIAFSEGLTIYDNDGRPCLTTVFDPKRVLTVVHAYFDSYIARLMSDERENDELRRCFKQKFEVAFGIHLPEKSRGEGESTGGPRDQGPAGGDDLTVSG